MGQLIYREELSIDIEDRVLSHLQLVIAAKLRRNESFLFSYDHGSEAGSGRSSIWLNSSIPLHFRYWSKKRITLNRSWIDVLMAAANGTDGLRALAEPEVPS